MKFAEIRYRSLLMAFLIIHCFIADIVFAGEAKTNAIVTGGEAFEAMVKQRPDFTIAVLPMENFSTDGDVAFYFRERVAERLRAKGYSLVDNNILDKGLHDIGVSHAGQLKLLEFDEVASLVGADAFLSGVVEQADVQHAGVYNSYVYTCSLKLQDREGKVIWSALQERVAKRRFALDPVNALLDTALVEGGGEKRRAIAVLADRLLQNMPDGPVQAVVGDSLFDKAIKVEAVEAGK